MKWRHLGCVVLLCAFPAFAYCTSFSGSKRLEALPGDAWMRPPSARLRLAAGAPVAFAPCSQGWVESSWRLGSSCLLWTLAGQLRAGAYSEQDLGLGLRVGGESLCAQARVHRQGRRVDGIAGENTMRGELALVLKANGFRFGVQQEFSLSHGPVELPSISAYAFALTGEFWSATLLREDSPFEAEGAWSAGLQLTLTALSFGFKGDEEGGSLQLGLRRGPWNFLLALPLASSIDAGPYLALEIGWPEGGASR